MAQRTKWWIATAVIAVASYAVLWIAVALHWKWLNSIDSAVLRRTFERLCPSLTDSTKFIS